MSTKTVYQTDRAGMFAGTTPADESPLEPGVFMLPAGAVETAPPETCPDDKWPRWNGASWDLVTRPTPPAPANDNDPLAKMMAFLDANPDVAEYLAAKKGGV